MTEIDIKNVVLLMNSLVYNFNHWVTDFSQARYLTYFHKMLVIANSIKKIAVLSHFKWVMREEIHRNSPLIKGELPTHFEKEPKDKIKEVRSR